VHEALHLDLMRTVALKVLDPERMGVDAERRFKVEARAIAQLEHENLVKLFEFGVAADGRPFYAMEYLTGESLDKKIEREKGMDYREAIAIGLQACRALETAHTASVIHRRQQAQAARLRGGQGGLQRGNRRRRAQHRGHPRVHGPRASTRLRRRAQ
jgi:serine/threonine-protein kinase